MTDEHVQDNVDLFQKVASLVGWDDMNHIKTTICQLDVMQYVKPRSRCPRHRVYPRS